MDSVQRLFLFPCPLLSPWPQPCNPSRPPLLPTSSPPPPHLHPLPQLFDVRAGLRLLYTLPTSGPPAALAFHPPPLGSACLLVALPSAAFCLADTASGGTSQVYQVGAAWVGVNGWVGVTCMLNKTRGRSQEQWYRCHVVVTDVREVQRPAPARGVGGVGWGGGAVH